MINDQHPGIICYRLAARVATSFFVRLPKLAANTRNYYPACSSRHREMGQSRKKKKKKKTNDGSEAVAWKRKKPAWWRTAIRWFANNAVRSLFFCFFPRIFAVCNCAGTRFVAATVRRVATEVREKLRGVDLPTIVHYRLILVGHSRARKLLSARK